MAGLPSRSNNASSQRRPLTSFGPSLLGASLALFIITRIVVWLPLGFVGTWINGLLWPILLLCLVVGGVLTWRKFSSD